VPVVPVPQTKMSKYGQKVEVEKTPDFVLSHPVHHARKIFLKTDSCKILSQGGLILRGANFAGRYGDRCELRRIALYRHCRPIASTLDAAHGGHFTPDRGSIDSDSYHITHCERSLSYGLSESVSTNVVLSYLIQRFIE